MHALIFVPLYRKVVGKSSFVFDFAFCILVCLAETPTTIDILLEYEIKLKIFN